MVLSDLIGDVLRTLWSHKLRTFLTMFGIAWGIVSIVLMVAAGEGLRKGQEDQAKTLGKDVMIVFHGRTSLQAGGTRAGRIVHWEDPDVPSGASRGSGLPICHSGIGAGGRPRPQQLQQCRFSGDRFATAVSGDSQPHGRTRAVLRLGR